MNHDELLDELTRLIEIGEIQEASVLYHDTKAEAATLFELEYMHSIHEYICYACDVYL